jgi:hypothetical protein
VIGETEIPPFCSRRTAGRLVLNAVGSPESPLNIFWLVIRNMNFMTFHILGRIMPSDELHHFSDGLEPPTRIEYD